MRLVVSGRTFEGDSDHAIGAGIDRPVKWRSAQSRPAGFANLKIDYPRQLVERK